MLLILFPFLVGCDGCVKTIEPDTRTAFVLDASKPFVIELGRGSGWHGLDIVRVDQTGAVQLSRNEGRQVPESATLQLSSADVAALIRLVETNQLTSMGRRYSDPRIADGTQWVLWIEQPPSQKAIYFNNSFPSQIAAFANGLDELLQKSGLGSAKWSPLPVQESIERQTALWDRSVPESVVGSSAEVSPFRFDETEQIIYLDTQMAPGQRRRFDIPLGSITIETLRVSDKQLTFHYTPEIEGGYTIYECTARVSPTPVEFKINSDGTPGETSFDLTKCKIVRTGSVFLD